MKRKKFLVGVTLLIQSVSFFLMFLMLCRKKKSLAKAILTVAALGGIAGCALLYLDSKDELARRHIAAARAKRPAEEPDVTADDESLFEEPDVNEVDISDDTMDTESSDDAGITDDNA